jgi:uncharacterized membrane protein YgdD (TMEM256/DUF423 family)
MDNVFYKRLLVVASLLGALGVTMGAFGAHFLKTRLPEQDLETIKTGVLYLFIHVLAAVLVSTLSSPNLPSRWLKLGGMAFLAGVFLFSGSLFLIATQSLTGMEASAIGWVTPLGGICFIGGWICLCLHGLKT